MQPNTSLKIDVTRILASIFWIGGAILTLVAAIEAFQKDAAAQTETKCEIERMEKQLKMLKGRL